MTDYLVFVGATPSLSTELLTLSSRLSVTVIAPAVSKQQRGATLPAIRRAICNLMQKMRTEPTLDRISRLSIWTFPPTGQSDFGLIWNEIGRYGWMEVIPSNLINKDLATRRYIEQRYMHVRECLHKISYEVYNIRRRSPFPLPLGNFQSSSLTHFFRHWYANQTPGGLQSLIDAVHTRFHRSHPGQHEGSVTTEIYIFRLRGTKHVTAYHIRPAARLPAFCRDDIGLAQPCIPGSTMTYLAIELFYHVPSMTAMGGDEIWALNDAVI